jgi:hypothetical protein
LKEIIMNRSHIARAVALLLAAPALSGAQSASADSYTRYELLAPETASFRIVYDVTATTAGAKYYFNPIRQGSEASDESVIDRMTGQTLAFEVVSGAQAIADGERGADRNGQYIRVRLARPVPQGGETRLRILKTYKDPKSYYPKGDLIVFDRSLGIKRNAVLLPQGYELVACNFPSQVIEEADGRILVSHLNNTPSAAPLVLNARKLPPRRPAGEPAAPTPAGAATPARPPTERPALAAGAVADPRSELENLRISERAFQDREIVYFLKQPETHAFSLYHDYTESRPGVDKYLNVVREGSTVSDPSASILDTGVKLATEILKGPDITRAGIEFGQAVRPSTEVVVIRFDPVQKGQSVRLRIAETYADPGRYGLVNGELVWHRAFGRPANDVLLPEGWYLTASSIPAVVRQERDGRIRLEFINPRPDEVDVILKGKRR